MYAIRSYYAAEAEIRKSGGKLLFVETSSRFKYFDTRSFYEKCGFSIHAVVKDFYSVITSYSIHYTKLYETIEP